MIASLPHERGGTLGTSVSPTLQSALFLPSSLVNSTICYHQAAGVAQSHDGTMEKAHCLWEGCGPWALSLARWKLGCRSVLARSRDSAYFWPSCPLLFQQLRTASLYHRPDLPQQTYFHFDEVPCTLGPAAARPWS